MNKSRKNNSLMFITSVLCTGVILFSIVSCNGGSKNTPTPSGDDKNATRSFPMTAIPAEMTNPQERATYLVTHYWDKFDFQDTMYIHLPEVTEQGLVNYLEVLPLANKEASEASIKSLMAKAEQDKTGKMHRYFIDNLKRYLSDPNSPMRNEDMYRPLVEYIISTTNPAVGIGEKESAKFDLEMLNKNMAGQPASDFTYTLSDGKTGTLHQIKSEYTLLFFYNPDCNACAEYTNSMKNSPHIQGFFEQGLLKILAFYPDEDLAIWKEHIKDIPSSWINGYDAKQVLLKKKVYDLNAIPTVYLLDRDKKVILKNVNMNQVFQWMEANNMGQPMVAVQ